MPKTILADVSGFTPLIDDMAKNHGLLYAAVFGRIWRFCQMGDGVCKASLERISEYLGINKATVMRYADRLVKDGYLNDLTPELRNAPHLYADTGKASIKIGIGATVADGNATVAPCNASGETVAQGNATVAQSQLKKEETGSKKAEEIRTGAALFEQILNTLRAQRNGTFEDLNVPLYSATEQPRAFVVMVARKDRALRDEIRTLAKSISGKAWSVKVVVNPPVVRGADLTPLQQQINALREKLERLAGAPLYANQQDLDAYQWMAEQGVTPDDIEATYTAMKQDEFWRNKTIRPQNIAHNLKRGGQHATTQPDTLSDEDIASLVERGRAASADQRLPG